MWFHYQILSDNRSLNRDEILENLSCCERICYFIFFGDWYTFICITKHTNKTLFTVSKSVCVGLNHFSFYLNYFCFCAMKISGVAHLHFFFVPPFSNLAFLNFLLELTAQVPALFFYIVWKENKFRNIYFRELRRRRDEERLRDDDDLRFVDLLRRRRPPLLTAGAGAEPVTAPTAPLIASVNPILILV